jgi:hypothetical protein
MISIYRPLVVSLLATATLQAQAATVVMTGTPFIDCTTLTFPAGSTFTYDRDNTGAGTEAMRVDILDGYGTVIATGTDVRPIGFTTPFGSTIYATTTPAAANPLTYRITSLAGNGFAEQVVLSFSGTCPGLPTVAPVAVPTLGEWGVLGLTALIGAAAVTRRRRQHV